MEPNTSSGNKKKIRKQPANYQFKDWLDTGAKYLGAVAGLLAIYVAHSFQATLTTTNLVNQREEAESSLRATMFGNLIGPLIGNEATKSTADVERELLLAELLTSNFHENFEFKPLLTHLDQRISKLASATDRHNKRNELISIARRVVQRQESLVTRPSNNGKQGSRNTDDSACLTDVIVLNDAKKRGATKIEDSMDPEAATCPDTVIMRADKRNQRKLISPDAKTAIEISFDPIDWKNETVKIRIGILSTTKAAGVASGGFIPPKGDYADYRTAIYEMLNDVQFRKTRTAGEQATLDSVKKSGSYLQKEFKLSWYDFPMTDYTLLSDGTRFAFYIDEIVKNEFMRVKLLWFPHDFFSPRERPTSYRAYRDRPWD